MDKSLEISGQTVFPGTKVNVKWLDTWYEGEVLELGPQSGLYKIKEATSELSVLLEKSQFIAIDFSRPTHEQFTAGANIAYYDNDLSMWMTATIEDIEVEGALLVKWRRDPSSNVNVNWFELKDVAPIIVNEAYGIEDVAMTSQSRLELPNTCENISLEDILNERPRHHKNAIFNGRSPIGPIAEQEPFENKLPDIQNFIEEMDSPYRVKGHRTSISMKSYYSKGFNGTPTKNTDSKLEHYLQNQAALLRGKIDYSLLPPIWSYFNHTKGIPHHPSSRFFRHMTLDPRLPRSVSAGLSRHYGSQGMMTTASSSAIKRTRSENFRYNMPKSPIMESKPQTDVAPYAQISIPPSLSQRKLTRQTTDMSTRPLPSLPDEIESLSAPYEVPLPLSSPASWTNLQNTQLQDPYLPDHPVYTDILSLDRTRTDSNLKAPPSIVASSATDLMVSAGGTTILYCEVKSEAPVTYEWTKNGRKLTPNDERVAFPSQGKLQLYSLCKADAGVYQCKVSNKGGTAVYTCKMFVEDESLKRSFSREYGLNKLASELPKPAEDKDNTEFNMDDISLSISLEEPNDDFQSQAPTYHDFPLNMARHPPSLASMKAALDRDAERMSTAIVKSISQELDEKKIEKRTKKDGKEHVTEKGSSSNTASKIENRKTKKSKQKRVSNVLMNEMEDYLEGYGVQYGNMNDDFILEQGINATKRKPEKKSQKKKKKKDKADKKQRTKEKVEQFILPPEITTTEHNTPIEEIDTNKMRHSADITEQNDEDNVPEAKKEEKTQTKSCVPIITVSVEEELSLPYEEGMLREDGEGEESQWQEFQPMSPERDDKDEDIGHDWDNEFDDPLLTAIHPDDLKPATSKDSINAHPSFESLLDDNAESEEINVNGLTREDGEGGEEKDDENWSRRGSSHVNLPLETQHYTEAVKRLQQSVQEYEEDHFGKDEKKPGRIPFKKLFKSNKQNNKIK